MSNKEKDLQKKVLEECIAIETSSKLYLIAEIKGVGGIYYEPSTKQQYLKRHGKDFEPIKFKDLIFTKVFNLREMAENNLGWLPNCD